MRDRYGNAISAFAIGPRELHDTIDRNPAFGTRAVDHTNLPHSVARNHNR